MPSEILITIENITKQITDRLLFEPASFGIHQSDKIGLIGVNGSGKSTLLKIIAGVEPSTSGQIVSRKELKVGYLPQIPLLNYNLNVISQVLFETQQSNQQNKHSGLQDTYETEDWSIESRAKSILTKLKLTDYDKPVGLLSGGQKRKVDLARVLMQNPDVLLLDEPTNHLDLDTIEWLQSYLAVFPGAVMLVTHDRYFLDAICTRVMEIDREVIHIYNEGYASFVEAKIQRMIDFERKETRRNAQLKKELEWLKRGARARATKPKSHVDRVKELLSKSYLISNQELNISFQTHRQGKTILELHKLSKSYDDNVLFTDIEHIFQAKERIGVLGPNGCGKTTLIRIMTGEEKLDSGSVKVGVNTVFAYYKQDQEDMNANISVLDYVNQFADVVKTADGQKFSASEMLQRFMFDGRMQQMKVFALSGGEKKRLHLMVSLMFGSNFMILDEPTNDLDIRTLEILEDYLDAYQGCIVAVSHDRFFLDRVCDYLFIFENGKLRKFAGNYSDYFLVKRYQEEEAEENAQKETQKASYRMEKTATGLSWKEKQEMLALEKAIEDKEAQLISLEHQMQQTEPPLSYEDYQRIGNQLEALKHDISESFSRWSSLADMD